jgi:predicted RNA-binding Zn ribbon-like protein
MHVAHDVPRSLAQAADLVNTRLGDEELLGDLAALRAFLDDHDVSGSRSLSADDLEEVHALRPRLRAVWAARDMRTAAAVVNGMVAEAGALPQLTDHDGHSWHLHWTSPSARVASRLGADAGMALAEVLREDGTERLRTCDAPGCDAVFVDLSRNRSRRYCDTGNCGNRMHVAAYRARLRSVDPARPGAGRSSG